MRSRNPFDSSGRIWSRHLRDLSKAEKMNSSACCYFFIVDCRAYIHVDTLLKLYGAFVSIKINVSRVWGRCMNFSSEILQLFIQTSSISKFPVTSIMLDISLIWSMWVQIRLVLPPVVADKVSRQPTDSRCRVPCGLCAIFPTIYLLYNC